MYQLQCSRQKKGTKNHNNKTTHTQVNQQQQKREVADGK
jgi:hypothetical protein